MAPEQYSGFWSRTCFAWLATTFRNGHDKIISLSDLPPLDDGLSSDLTCRKMVSTWAKCEPETTYEGKNANQSPNDLQMVSESAIASCVLV